MQSIGDNATVSRIAFLASLPMLLGQSWQQGNIWMLWGNVAIMFRFSYYHICILGWLLCILSLISVWSFNTLSLTSMSFVGPSLRKFQIAEFWFKSPLSWMYKNCLWFCQWWAAESHQREGASSVFSPI